MHMFTCPRCKAQSIPLSDKFKSGLWQTISCKSCGAKLIALPILLALLHFTYVWNVAWLCTFYYFDLSGFYYAGLILVWALIEAMNVWYMPLAAIRSSPAQ